MKGEDMKIQALYAELYNNTHASDELKGKVRAMANNEKATRRAIKGSAILAAAAIALVGGTLATAATHKTYIGQYTTAYINGEEVKARYGEWDTIGEYIVEAEKGGKTYTAYVAGEYDKDTMPLYFRDEGNYVIASTDPEQQLNLYEDIDKAPHAMIDGNWLMTDSSYLHADEETPDDPEELYRYYAFQDSYANHINLDFDADDGKIDGVLKYDMFTRESYIVSPEGLLISASKSRGSAMSDDCYVTLWGLIWGEETEESFNEYMEAYRDSDGIITVK